MPFEPGQSGNPKGGPPKHDSLNAIIRTFGDEREGEGKRTRWERLVKAMFDEGFAGNVKAATWLADRAFGKPKDDQADDDRVITIIMPGVGGYGSEEA